MKTPAIETIADNNEWRAERKDLINEKATRPIVMEDVIFFAYDNASILNLTILGHFLQWRKLHWSSSIKLK